MTGAIALMDKFKGTVKDANDALAQMGGALGGANTGITSMSRRLGTATAWQQRFNAAIKDSNGALARQGAMLGAVGAGTAAGGGAAFGARWFGLALNATTLHWLIAGGAEIAAVTVPAMIALGAAAAAAIEGVTNLSQHMEAVYTASEATSKMFGKTAGNLIGLKSYLQKAQDAADPEIYGILGSAIKTVQEHFGGLANTGTQVIGVMQTFAAKVAADFQPGGVMGSSVDTLLSHMVSDLTGIGQVFGNLGNSVVAFGAQMPGLAEILLRTFANLTGWAAQLIDLSAKFHLNGATILTVVMAYEEFNRWGGLTVRMLGSLGLASNASKGAIAAGAFSFARFEGILRSFWSILPNVIAGIGNFTAKMGAKGLGAGMNGLADGIGMGISALSGWQLALVTAGAVGLGFLIDKLVTAQSAVQRLSDAMQKNVLSQSNVNAPKVIAANMAVLNSQLVQATKNYKSLEGPLGRTMEKGRAGGRGLELAISRARTAVQQYNQAIQTQQGDQQNVVKGAQWISKAFGTTMAGALILADNANVKLANGILGTNHALSIAQLQIDSLVLGYRAMGQSGGEVGADMTALAIQSGLAGTQVSKLNSAWDDFLGNMTGGTSGLGGFVQSIKNMGQVVASAKNNLEKASSINLTTGQFASALTNFGQVGSQAWQNFGQVVGSTAPQVIDWLRQAGAMGVLNASQFSNAVLGMVSSLTKFAAKSPAAQAQLLALAQQANPNITTWGKLKAALDNGNISFSNTAKAVELATVKMGNMAQVAQNLGNVMNSNLLSTMSNATISASGVAAATQKYMHDIMNTGTAISATAKDRSALLRDLESLGYGAKQASQFIQALQGQINGLHGKTITITAITRAVSGGPAAGPYRSGYRLPTGSAIRGANVAAVIPQHAAAAMAGGGGDIVIHNNMVLDGRTLYRSTQRHATGAARTSGTNGLAPRRR